MEKCNCYKTCKERHYLSDFERGVRVGQGEENILFEDRIIAYCAGTKECEACKCDGDRCKCDFYDDVRKEAKIQYAKEQKARSEKTANRREHEELEFYRQWILEHDLRFELMNDFEKWKKEKMK